MIPSQVILALLIVSTSLFAGGEQEAAMEPRGQGMDDHSVFRWYVAMNQPGLAIPWGDFLKAHREDAFDPQWGSPESVSVELLQDWTEREEPGIRYYSGIVTYRKNVDMPEGPLPWPVGQVGHAGGGRSRSAARVYLHLGTVRDMVRVCLNGTGLGVVWCAPWRVDVTETLKDSGKLFEIDVANRWPNRLLGDERPPDKEVRTVKWESGLLSGREFKTGRYTLATSADPNQLLPLGLIGPVRMLITNSGGKK